MPRQGGMANGKPNAMIIDHDRWRLVSPLLDHVLELTDDERVSWLASQRNKDCALAAEVEALLAEGRAARTEGFLEQQPTAFLQNENLAGQAIGAYTLEASIGQGGM